MKHTTNHQAIKEGPLKGHTRNMNNFYNWLDFSEPNLENPSISTLENYYNPLSKKLHEKDSIQNYLKKKRIKKK